MSQKAGDVLKEGAGAKFGDSFEFSYPNGEFVLGRSRLGVRRGVKVTVNMPYASGITTGRNGGYHGRSICRPEDQFVKEIGRRLAVIDAIGHLPRELRAIVFKAYNLRISIPHAIQIAEREAGQ